MRRYSPVEESNVRVGERIREWARSGLLSPTQAPRLEADVHVDLRRTNGFIRLLLLVFGLVVTGASVVLVIHVFDLSHAARTAATVMLVAAAASVAVADALVARHRLYRFGIEEACSVAGVLLASGGAAMLAGDVMNDQSERVAILTALLVAATVSTGVYLRFGPLYAALGGVVCIALAPFHLGMPDALARTCAALVLVALFFTFRTKRLRHGDEFPGDDHGILQAAAWAGLYLTLNLQITNARDVPRTFYWLTYVATFVIPVIGLRLGIRDRDRSLLDVSLAMTLATIVTNKPYLGLTPQTWDPILFGIAVIAAAVVLRRWLRREPRGFTAQRLLSRDADRLAMLGTASTLAQPAPPAAAPSDTPGGGQFGGAGASDRW